MPAKKIPEYKSVESLKNAGDKLSGNPMKSSLLKIFEQQSDFQEYEELGWAESKRGLVKV